MKGASPKAIQELMRHADLAMTGRYTHLSPAARESAVRLLDGVGALSHGSLARRDDHPGSITRPC
jgi:hypothetical protein